MEGVHWRHEMRQFDGDRLSVCGRAAKTNAAARAHTLASLCNPILSPRLFNRQYLNFPIFVLCAERECLVILFHDAF